MKSQELINLCVNSFHVTPELAENALASAGVISSNLSDRRYIDNDGKFCPYCGAEDCFEMDPIIFSKPMKYHIRCTCCDQDWTEEYSLTGIFFPNQE